MRSLSELQDKIRSLVLVLADRYQVESIALFGSYVRQEQRPGSDLDMLVTFREAPSLFQFLQLEYYLSDTLGVKVDLVMKDGLKPRIGERILSEAMPI
ncbi:MAG: nucleotidyltransferase family protein [Anaerolineae bacterium]